MSNEVDTWVKRFRVLDTQEEEAIDDSVQYRALLVQGREEQVRRNATQAEAKARKPR
ncbi:MAG TPA: hypothetical protein VGM15_05680 [Burkholderiaceae bacterium]|jgi:hypothetical protein